MPVDALGERAAHALHLLQLVDAGGCQPLEAPEARRINKTAVVGL